MSHPGALIYVGHKVELPCESWLPFVVIFPSVDVLTQWGLL